MRIPPWRLDRWLCEWIAPLVCIGCELPVETPPNDRARSEFCEACGPLVEPTHERIGVASHAVAAFRYGGPLRDAIMRLKYRGASEAGRPLGRMLATCLEAGVVGAHERPLVVVPVPLHQNRLTARGYNQAALIARGVGRELRAPVSFDSLLRTRDTAAQVGLTRSQRTANVRGSFALARKAGFQVERSRVLLVDDVVTTGATLDEARKPFLDAGAQVLCVALARSDD